MYEKFEQWVDKVLGAELPSDVVAICFNLYEESDNNWSIQLIASDCFDKDDEDWVCEEVFTTGEDLFTWNSESGWEIIFKVSKKMVLEYLKKGKYTDKLKIYQAVAIGFVDGDIELLYVNNI